MAGKKSSTPEVVTMSEQELSSLQSRISSGELSAADRALVISVLETMRLLYKTVKKANTTIGTLRRWFGFKKTERKPSSKSTGTATGSDANKPPSLDGLGGEASASDGKKKPEKRDPAANHGRMSGEEYTGCAQEVISHGELSVGSDCPHCSGKLGEHPMAKIIRLTGSPLINGTAYHVEAFRCNTCRSVIKADVPDEISKSPKYEASCRTNIALGRYGYGLPFK